MTDLLDTMLTRARKGVMSRREFMARTTAMGVSAGIASALYGKVARADEPKKGGVIRGGIYGGESTNSLDPALAASPVPVITCSTWGEMLCDVTPDGGLDMRVAEEASSSPDAKVWTFKIRQGVEFHNGKTVTAEDVVATLKRHTDEKSQSGALGIVQGIAEMKAEGDKVSLTLTSGNSRPALSACRLPPGIQPNGGFDNPTEGIGAGPYKVETFEPGVRTPSPSMPTISTVRSAMPTRSRSCHQRQYRPHGGAAVRPGPYDQPGGSEDRRTAEGLARWRSSRLPAAATMSSSCMRQGALRQQRPADGAEAGDQPAGDGGQDPGRPGFPRQRFPDQRRLSAVRRHHPQREYDAAAAADYYKKSGHDGSPIILRAAPGAFPGAVDAANLFAASANAAGIPLQVKLEPDDGYWSNVWNVEPFCASYWGGRPVQDQMYTTAYLSTADWNDTKFKNMPSSTNC
jgi:peptide/nickel transport system substrate-binding protein